MSWKKILKNQTKLPKEMTEGATVSTIPAERWGDKPPETPPPKKDKTTKQTSLKDLERKQVSDTDLRTDVIKELVEGLKTLLELIERMDSAAPNIPLGDKGNLESKIANHYSTIMGTWDELRDIMYKVQYQLQND